MNHKDTKTQRIQRHRLLVLCICGLLSSCATATRVQISSPQKTVDIVFPKNLNAERLDFDLDPVTGEIRFRASKLRTDGSKVIESAGAALGDAAKSLAPLVK